MKICTLLVALLAACAVAYAQGPLLQALQPASEETQQLEVAEPQNRPKRGLLLAGAGLGLLGAGAIGAGALGVGALGAGALVGAKAGLIGGAIASKAFHGYGRSYGGYGHGYGYGGGYGGGYHSYAPSYYGGGYGGGYHSYSPSYHRSYPAYVVEETWY